MSVMLRTDSVDLRKSQVLFPARPSVFEASADGKRLLMMQAPVENSSNLALVVDWPRELRK